MASAINSLLRFLIACGNYRDLYAHTKLQCMSFLTEVNVSLANSHYLVREGDEFREVCVEMQGRAAGEISVQLSSRNLTALCE